MPDVIYVFSFETIFFIRTKKYVQFVQLINARVILQIIVATFKRRRWVSIDFK